MSGGLGLVILMLTVEQKEERRATLGRWEMPKSRHLSASEVDLEQPMQSIPKERQSEVEYFPLFGRKRRGFSARLEYSFQLG